MTRILISAGQDESVSPRRRLRAPAVLAGALTAAAAAMAGCDRPVAPDAPTNVQADKGGYVAPPTLAAASRDANGETTLSGLAPPTTEVRLRDPGGAAYSAIADRDGGWSVRLPASPKARMFAFEGSLDARLLHAEGAILVLPAPGPAAVLTRAGYGALSMGGARGLAIQTIDDDGAGGGAVSGHAAPRAPVRLVLDNGAVGMGEADDQGRFTLLNLSARAPFSPGPHVVRVESRGAAVDVPLTVQRPRNLGDAPFTAAREPNGWRAEWRIPGGGQQATLVLDLPPARPAAPARPPS